MKKSKLFAALLAIILLLPVPARGEGALPFGEDGTFTILVLSDVEEGPSLSPYYASSLSRLLEMEAPDLVIFLGDQLAGEKRPFHLGNREEQARSAVLGLIAPLEEVRVPFVPVLGAQDLSTGLSGANLLELYQESPLCLRETGASADVLSILPWEGEEPCLELVFFDASRPASDLGPTGATQEQVDWYLEHHGEAEDILSDPVPVVSFAHAALPEIYDALTPALSRGEDTITGPDGLLYERDAQGILLGVMNEAPAIPRENNGLLSAFSQAGNVFLSVSGNNHTNAFLTAVKGVDLLSCPSASYVAKSDRAIRGAWLIRFSEDNVEDYELRFVPFSHHENLNNGGWLVYALSTYFILSPKAKAGILMGILVLCLGAAIFLGKRGKDQPLEQGEGLEEPDEDGE